MHPLQIGDNSNRTKGTRSFWSQLIRHFNSFRMSPNCLRDRLILPKRERIHVRQWLPAQQSHAKMPKSSKVGIDRLGNSDKFQLNETFHNSQAS